MSKSPKDSKTQPVNTEALTNIKSAYLIEKVFSFLEEKKKLELMIHSKRYQTIFKINIDSYKKKSGRYKIDGINGLGKEFSLDNDNLVFEGEYLHGKRNGKGKEYTVWGSELIFEGEYLNGKKNGKGKEYYYNRVLIEGEYLAGERAQEKNEKSKQDFYKKTTQFEGEYLNGLKHGQGKEFYTNGKIKFEGQYLKGLKWNGKGYDTRNNISYELKEGTGIIKEYYDYGDLKFEGELLNGKKHGKGKEYLYHYGPLEFDYYPYFPSGSGYNEDKYLVIGFFSVGLFNSYEGEYLNGLRNGKGKEFYINGKIKFEGEYLNGKRWKGKGYNPKGNIEYGMKNGLGYVKEYYHDGKIKLEAKYVNGVKHGYVKEYYIEYRKMDFWQCEQIENKEFYYLEFEGVYLNGERNGKGKVNNIRNLLEFEGEYLNGKRNGKGKIYYSDGDLLLEAEYANGKIKHGIEYLDKRRVGFDGEYKNGKKIKGKKYEYFTDGKLKFEGEYINGKKWNGKGFNKNGKIIFELKEGKGFIKEFSNRNDRLEFEGEYSNGERNGKGKEFNYDNKLEYKGEYLNGERWNGTQYNYNYNGKLDYINEYKEGKKGRMKEMKDLTDEEKLKYNQEVLDEEKIKKEEKEKEEKESKEINENKKQEEQKEDIKEQQKEKNKDDKSEEEKNKIPIFVNNYGKEVGIPNLKLDYDNKCELCFDGKINIGIKYNEKENLCSFIGPICSIPKNDKEKFYKQLLISNAFGIENGGAVLSIEEKTNRIMLSFTFIANTFDYKLFKVVLNNFVNIVETNMNKYEKLLKNNS